MSLLIVDCRLLIEKQRRQVSGYRPLDCWWFRKKPPRPSLPRARESPAGGTDFPGFPRSREWRKRM